MKKRYLCKKKGLYFNKKTMKRFVIIALSVLAGLSIYGQKTVYVLFTSIPDGGQQAYVEHLEREGTHLFAIQNRSLGYVYDFLYFTSDGPIPEKPLSFLDAVPCIDWDRIGPQLDKRQAAERIQYILARDSIYFVDRNDIEEGKVRPVPVRRMKSAF